MFKFLRKYNKWILAVGGTLLMIVFLIPQAIESLSQRAAVSGSQWGVVGEDREKLSGADRVQAEQDLQNMERLGSQVLGLGAISDPVHWHLLVREAEAAGLVGAPGSTALTEDQRQLVRNMIGSSGEDTLARLDGVQRMIALYATAPKLSDRRLKSLARDQFYGVEARMVVLQAEASAEQPDPSSERIREHFEKYRDVVPGAGEHGFGYRYPDRFKLEWLAVDAGDVRAWVESDGAVDDVALMRHWQQAGPEEGFPTIERGAEIPDVVREDLVKTLTNERLEEIANYATDRFRAMWRALTTTIHGHYNLPDDWSARRLALPVLAEDLRAEFEGLPLPSYQSTGEQWLSVEDLPEQGAISAARTTAFGNTPMDLASLLPLLREFNPDETPSILLQTGVAGPPLRGTADQSIYFFRVLAADPAHAPQSLDEVRDEIVTDLKRLEDYERLTARADELRQKAIEEGLLALAIEHDTIVQPVARISEFDPGQVSLWLRFNFRQPPQPLPVIGEDEQAIRAIVDRALAMDHEGPLMEVPLEERLFVQPVDSKLALLIGEIVQEHPLSREQYMTMTGYQDRLQTLALTDEQQEGYRISDVFGAEAMIARHKFEFAREDDEEQEAPAESTASVE